MPQFEVTLEANGLSFGAFSSFSAQSLERSRRSRLVLLLHGFPDDRTTWNAVWPQIVDDDPHSLVLAPALRGYEPGTAHLKGNYSIKQVAGDIIAIAEKYARGSAIYVVGHDWGAIVTYMVATLRPDLIRGFVALSIPYLASRPLVVTLFRHPQQIWLSSYQLTMHLPYFYRPRFQKSMEYLTSLWEYWSPGWTIPKEDIEHVWKTLNQPGVIDAATSYYRNISYYGIDWKVDFSKVPGLIIGGAKDGCMSSKLMEDDFEWIRGTKGKIVIVPEVGHFMAREKPEVIAKLIIDFINSN